MQPALSVVKHGRSPLMSFKEGDLLEITLREPEWSRPFVAEFLKTFQTPKNEFWILKTEVEGNAVIVANNIALARQIPDTKADKEEKK